MLQNLCGMLMRFRLHKIGLVADIEKAFLQVGLQQSDRNVTRFLWCKDIKFPSVRSENIEEYRFCRVPFEVISSPFLLGATIDSHLLANGSDCAERIRKDIYVDNLVTGAKSVNEAIEIYSESKRIFGEASMNLREWISNDQGVNEFFRTADKGNLNCVKVLGHVWNVDIDCLSMNSSRSLVKCNKQTKRTTLKDVAELFDPLGLFTPVTLLGKVFIQELWKKKLSWDEELNQEEIRTWNDIRKQLQEITELQIKRSIDINAEKSSVKYRLLCFCDASARAYAAAVYIHQESENMSKCDLVFSKSRLAPVKGLTIPRLELMAVLIGVRCLEFVQKELRLSIEGKFLWSDSQCVLKWIATKKELSVFVRNRISEIKRHSDIKFAYISTSENPADIATRGTSTKKTC